MQETDRAITNAVVTFTAKNREQIVGLKLTRADLVLQIVYEARREHQLLLDNAKREANEFALKFVDMVNQAAMKKAKAVIDTLSKISPKNTGFSPKFSMNVASVRDLDDWERTEGRISPSENVLQIKFEQGSYSSSCFYVEISLTQPMLEAREKFRKAAIEYQRLNKTNSARIADLRSDVQQKLIRETIDSSPEGKMLMKMLDSLRKRVEEKTGQNILENSAPIPQ